ncbi:hypothetical protein ISCGN_031595 [Ixodes scapularis]
MLHQQHTEEEITKPIDKSKPPEEARDQQEKSRQRELHSGIRSPDCAVYAFLLYSYSRCHLERRFSSLQAQHAPTALRRHHGYISSTPRKKSPSPSTSHHHQRMHVTNKTKAVNGGTIAGFAALIPPCRHPSCILGGASTWKGDSHPCKLSTRQLRSDVITTLPPGKAIFIPASPERANDHLTSLLLHQQHTEEEITKPIDKSPPSEEARDHQDKSRQRKNQSGIRIPDSTVYTSLLYVYLQSLPPGKAILIPASAARANCPLTSSLLHQQHAEEEITKPIDKSPPPEEALAATWKGDSHPCKPSTRQLPSDVITVASAARRGRNHQAWTSHHRQRKHSLPPGKAILIPASPARANCPLTSSLLHQQHAEEEITKPIDKSPPPEEAHSLPPGKAILIPASPARANCPLTSSLLHQQHAEEEITKPIDKSPPPEEARDQQDKSRQRKHHSGIRSPDSAVYTSLLYSCSRCHLERRFSSLQAQQRQLPSDVITSLPPGKAILIPASPARANYPLTSSLLHQQHAEEEITKPIDKSPPPEEARGHQDKSRQRKNHSGIRTPDSALYRSLLYSCSRCHLESRFSSLQAQHAPTAL